MDRSFEEEESPWLLPQPTVGRSNPIDANRTTKATVEETRKSQLQQGHDLLDHCPWREMAVRMPPLVQAHQHRTQAKRWSRIVQPSPPRSNHGEGQSDGTEKVRHETRHPRPSTKKTPQCECGWLDNVCTIAPFKTWGQIPPPFVAMTHLPRNSPSL